jgi:hypothetical protein
LTGLLAGRPRSRGSIPVRDSLSHVQSVRTGSRTQPAISPSPPEVNLTAGLHPIPKSGISGATPPFPFVTCKGIIVPLHSLLTRSICVVSIISYSVFGSIRILHFQYLLSVILFSRISGCEKERFALLLLFHVRKSIKRKRWVKEWYKKH